MFGLGYLIFLAPALIFSLWASWRVKSTFKKYSRERARTGMTGAEAARRLLDQAGIQDVEIKRTSGLLSDHYNPVSKTLALSDEVYDSPSVAAIGVACHEAGHAIQHQQGYFPLWLRSTIVPTASIGSNLGYFVMMIGALLLFMGGGQAGAMVIYAGAALFSAVLVFQLVTLPVEFDASKRAKRLAFEQGIIVTEQEQKGVSKVLNAAAMTYVAAVVSTLLTLAYYLLLARSAD